MRLGNCFETTVAASLTSRDEQVSFKSNCFVTSVLPYLYSYEDPKHANFCYTLITFVN
jgi:hypothetical protein